MNSGYLTCAAVVCVFVLSSCNKEHPADSAHSPELEAADIGDPARGAVQDHAVAALHVAPSTSLRAPQAPATPLAGMGRHTPTEARFVTGDALDVPLVGRAFHGDWSETIRQLKGDSVADQDAIELGRVYEKEIEAALARFNSLELKEFACGVTLCAGTITSREKGAYAQWRKSTMSVNQPPVFSFIDMEVQLPSSTDYRFAFSTDRTAPGLRGQL